MKNKNKLKEFEKHIGLRLQEDGWFSNKNKEFKMKTKKEIEDRLRDYDTFITLMDKGLIPFNKGKKNKAVKQVECLLWVLNRNPTNSYYLEDSKVGKLKINKDLK